MLIQTVDLMNAIQERMTDAGMTQADVGKKAGIGQAHVSNLLSGRVADPQVSTIFKLCDAVGITVQFIVPRVAK